MGSGHLARTLVFPEKTQGLVSHTTSGHALLCYLFSGFAPDSGRFCLAVDLNLGSIPDLRDWRIYSTMGASDLGLSLASL